ncbi:hypothetical protein AZI86_07445 [Bdellovibrio bacteriovorus]|uniref:Uncharacterized protein n=1 Tax=Bdellovibrio bacteriovorus TaxID=959 RepID=A0A150WR18_BDEBC|nr:hypothetical protein [Bdellovibrio bacteriovorus]KYG66860.1 hypothetical protein AZI86_07445 [Bdellovibrio bacteriovorus]
MKWFKKLLTLVALINLVVGPVAAQVRDQKQEVKPEDMRQVLESMGYKLKPDEAGKNVLIVDKEGKVVMEVPYADKSNLRKYSPKSMQRMMLEEMTRVKMASKGAWSHSVRSLPTESAIFFMAMGAVVAGQLVTNYSQNPVGMKQHMDHSMSPLGVFGFFTFMYSQGVTSNVLAMYIQNKNFQVLIPYLGMTVGAFLQTYLSSFVSDPNVKMCANSWIGAKKSASDEEAMEACEKAYEYFTTTKKIWEFAPGIVSMLVSSALAAVGQKVVEKTVLRITGVDIALWFAPGTMQLKGMRLLLVKGLQITAFVAIDALIMRKITYIWKNIFDGADFYDQNDRLNNLLNEMKASNWQKDEKALIHEVKDFREKMTNWRMTNMSAVYEAHQNWSESLQQLTSMYNTSYSVYQDVTEQIRTARFQNVETPMMSPILLAGVKAKDLADDRQHLYLTRPEFVVGPQLETAKDVALKIDSYLQQGDDKVFLYPAEKKSLKKAADLLRSEDQQKVLAGIRELNSMKESIYANNSSEDAIKVVQELWSILGDPVMPKGLGQGYFATYEKSPSTADKLKGTNYYRVTGAFQTPNITDYLVMQMICGPDAENGGRLVRNSLGYPSVFAPPQIAAANVDLFNCNAIGANLPSDQIYSREIQYQGKTYQGSIPYLLAAARPSVIGTADASNFEDWWKKKTEKQVMDAFKVYSEKYQTIVAQMVKGIFEPGKSVFNGAKGSITWSGIVGLWDKKQAKRNMEGGPIMNGGLNSSYQEMNIYLAMLEDLMKPSKEFNLDFSETLNKGPSIEVLKNVDAEFRKLETLLRRIKIVTVNKQEAVSSDLENYELEEQVQKIQTALNEVSKTLGVGEEDSAESAKMPKARRDLAVQVIEQLEALASEIMMYGSMANAVTWEKIRDMKRINSENNKFQNEIQKKVDQLRGVLGARH